MECGEFITAILVYKFVRCACLSLCPENAVPGVLADLCVRCMWRSCALFTIVSGSDSVRGVV